MHYLHFIYAKYSLTSDSTLLPVETKQKTWYTCDRNRPRLKILSYILETVSKTSLEKQLFFYPSINGFQRAFSIARAVEKYHCFSCQVYQERHDVIVI